MIGKIKLSKGKSFDIDGIIKQYQVASGGNVSAGDFVKYIENITVDLYTDTQLSNTEFSGNMISAVALSSTKVFIATGNKDSYLYGIVCTISASGLITKGTYTRLSSVLFYAHALSVVALNESKVFIAYGVSSSSVLAGIVCTIVGTTITAGTYKMISSNIETGDKISAVALSSTSVFIAHDFNSSNEYLYGIVCTISGTTITAGTDTQLSSNTFSGNMMSAINTYSDRVFIAHSYDSGGHLYGMVCIISGTTITTGTDTSISTTLYSTHTLSITKISTTKIFIAHSLTSTGQYANLSLYGIVCTINNTSISKGVDTQLQSFSNSNHYASATKLSSDEVFIAFNYSSSNLIYGTICKINGTTITKEYTRDLGISGTSISAVALGESNKVFIAHYVGSNQQLYARTCNKVDYLKVSKLSSASDKIFGVAKTSATGGNNANIIVPNI